MLPQFPNFAPVGAVPASDLWRIAQRFDSYSEYNPTNMQCWPDKYRAISLLNENLVLRFRDSGSGEEHLSFLGTESLLPTVAVLLDAAEETGGGRRLRLVPEAVVAGEPELRRRFTVIEDQDADYLLSVEDWARLEGRDYKRARYNVADFGRRYRAELREVDLRSPRVCTDVHGLFQVWARQKGVQDAPSTLQEWEAIERLLTGENLTRMAGYGMYEGSRLVAFLILEPFDSRVVTLHFWKADWAWRGVTMASLHHSCRELSSQGYVTLNIGQDLGLAGLAAAKWALRPRELLRKYVIADEK